MKIRVGIGLLLSSSAASAGGLFLPGAGAISTSRAGAAVASADDGEALAMNPAGLAKAAPGTTITISAAIISYSMEFTRTGTYDNISAEDPAYEGTPYPTVKNKPNPKLGIGSYQPVPVIAVVSDLGGAIKNMKFAIGLYAPNAYPFRNMNEANGQQFSDGNGHFIGDFEAAPPPTRYDIVDQDAAVILPSVAASYRISDKLDVGARLSAGFANLKSTVTLWGQAGNVQEFIKQDTLFHVEAKDNFVPAFGLGLTYRPSPALEIGAAYNSQATIHAKGNATSETGPQVTVGGAPITVGPIDDAGARCATGGSFDAQKVCVDFALPMSATLGARYKLLGATGNVKGDLELDLGWENWGADLVSNYNVVVDAAIYINDVPQLDLRDNQVRHGSQDAFTARLGGSYHLPQGANEIILRGGVGYDTASAQDGWLRADIDGAARTTMTAGGSYRTKRLQVDLGGGFIYEGTPTNSGVCNPVQENMLGCNGDGNERPLDQRRGPDPIFPLSKTEDQIENPVTLGKYKSHYVLLMLGMSTWF